MPPYSRVKAVIHAPGNGVAPVSDRRLNLPEQGRSALLLRTRLSHMATGRLPEKGYLGNPRLN